MKIKKRGLLVGISFALATVAASGYGPGGHYYSLMALYVFAHDDDAQDSRLGTVQPPMSDWQVESFCAELPDQARELDAITQRINIIFEPESTWSSAGQCNTAAVKNMARTQFYIHGLNGSNSTQTRIAAGQLVEEFNKKALAQIDLQSRYLNLCAAGFALHLFGDGFAHTQKTHEGNDGKQYVTGIGHGWQLSFPDLMDDAGVHANGDKYPDWIHAVAANAALGVSKERIAEVAQKMKPYVDQPTNCTGHDDEACRISNLESSVRKASLTFFFKSADLDKFASRGLTGRINEHCDDQLKAAVKAHYLPMDFAVSCDAVWNAYGPAAEQVFQHLEISMDGTQDRPDGASCSIANSKLKLEDGA